MKYFEIIFVFDQHILFHFDVAIILFYIPANSVNGMSEYIYFNRGQSWNTARSVCGSIGGYLARFDTLGLFQMAEAQTADGFPWKAKFVHKDIINRSYVIL